MRIGNREEVGHARASFEEFVMESFGTQFRLWHRQEARWATERECDQEISSMFTGFVVNVIEDVPSIELCVDMEYEDVDAKWLYEAVWINCDGTFVEPHPPERVGG